MSIISPRTRLAINFGQNYLRKIIIPKNVTHPPQNHYCLSVNKEPLKFFILEAFTLSNNQRHTGNPAGVCVLKYDDDIPDEEKQKIASTLNLSVTAFVSTDWNRSKPLLSKNSSGQQGSVVVSNKNKILKRTLRWFTPIKEIQLCGHATLATSFGLLHDEEEKDDVEKIEFYSKYRGILSASSIIMDPTTHPNQKKMIGLHFPANSTIKISLKSTWLPSLVKIILGPAFAFDKHFFVTCLKDVQYCDQESILLLRLKKNPNETSLQTIQRVCPNFDQLLQVDLLGDELKVQGFIVTIEGDSDGQEEEEDKEEERPNFYSRYFAPHIGINEDVATGVSHTILTPYWTQELGFSDDDEQQPKILKSHQASPGRGGHLWCLLEKGGQRVRLAGRANILVKGELNI